MKRLMPYNNILSEEELKSLLTPQEREQLEDTPLPHSMKLVETVSILEETVARLSMRVNHLERQMAFQRQLQTAEIHTAAEQVEDGTLFDSRNEASAAGSSSFDGKPSPVPQQTFIPRSERHKK